MTTGDENHMRRIAVAGGLRDLAAFIERTLDFPVPPRIDISYPVISDSDQAEREEVSRIANILGETPRYQFGDQHYTVTRDFGPVTFSATAITREYMARYHAEMEAARRFAREMWGQ